MLFAEEKNEIQENQMPYVGTPALKHLVKQKYIPNVVNTENGNKIQKVDVHSLKLT